jgi:hypothetical protein
MSTVTLSDALNIAKIDAGYGSNIASERINGNSAVCFNWNGFDSVGRSVCAPSYYTKDSGCNQAMDRIMVENTTVRPQYTEYASLNLSGLLGMPTNNVQDPLVAIQSQAIQNLSQITGKAGFDYNKLRAGAGPSLAYSQGAVQSSNRMSDYSMQAYTQAKLNRSIGM